MILVRAMRRNVKWGGKARAWFEQNEREIMAGLDRGNTTGRPTPEVAMRGKYGELAWSDLYGIPVDMSADVNTHKNPDARHPRTGVGFDIKTRLGYVKNRDGSTRELSPIYMPARVDALEQHPDYRLQLVVIQTEMVLVAGGIVAEDLWHMAMDASTPALGDSREVTLAYARADLPIFVAHDKQRVLVNIRHDRLVRLHDWESASELEPDLGVHARSWP